MSLGIGKRLVFFWVLALGFLPGIDGARANRPAEAKPAQVGTAGSWYASPDGSPGGDGSILHPWDLQTALWGGLKDKNAAAVFSNHLVKPGDTVWLRGGIYTGPYGSLFQSYLRGSETRPILIRQYPGERAVVNPGIQTYGKITNEEINYDKSSAYTWFWGFEVTNTQRRNLPESERWKRGPGLQFFGKGHKAINIVFRDAGHPAIQAGEWAENAEIYGCIIWGTGLYQNNDDGTVTIRGSGVYAQNKTDVRLVSDLISFRNFTTGMKTWSQEAHGYGFKFDGNISFDNGDRNIFAGSDNPLKNLTLTHNTTYRLEGDLALSVQLGYSQYVRNEDLQVVDNYFVGGSRVTDQGGLSLQSWISGEVAQNTIVEHRPVVGSPNYTLVGSYYEPEPDLGKLYIHDNGWYGPANRFWFNHWNPNGNFTYELLDFTTWASQIGYDAARQMGFDLSSNTYTQSLPTGTKVFLRPNKYEAGRAHIAIYNWDQKSTVSVDLSSLLKNGDRYQIIDVQNYFGNPVVTGTYSGNRVSIPMNLTKVQPLYDPYGEIKHLQNRHTAPEFAAFVLISREPAPAIPTPEATATPMSRLSIETAPPPGTRVAAAPTPEPEPTSAGPTSPPSKPGLPLCAPAMGGFASMVVALFARARRTSKRVFSIIKNGIFRRRGHGDRKV